MRAWLIRFVSLYVFDVLVLLLIDAFVPGVRVGWAVLWAAVILTFSTLWVKPLVHRILRSVAARSAAKQSKLREKLVQLGLVLLVAAVVWVLTLLLTGVRVSGGVWTLWGLWGYVVPPLLLLAAWAVYDAIDDLVEAKAGQLYDRLRGRGKTTDAESAPAAPPVPLPRAETARRELYDGLTQEQRKLFDELDRG